MCEGYLSTKPFQAAPSPFTIFPPQGAYIPLSTPRCIYTSFHTPSNVAEPQFTSLNHSLRELDPASESLFYQNSIRLHKSQASLCSDQTRPDLTSHIRRPRPMRASTPHRIALSHRSRDLKRPRPGPSSSGRPRCREVRRLGVQLDHAIAIAIVVVVLFIITTATIRQRGRSNRKGS